jgi:hypothetical protein
VKRPRVASIALIALAGCPKAEAPLEAQRQELAALDRVPMPEGWAPQASVVVSDQMVQALVERAVKASPKVPEVAIDGPLGLTIHAEPHPNPPTLELRSSPRGPWCVDVAAASTGTVGLSMGGMGGNVGWRSDLLATFDVEGRPGASGFDIDVLPVERNAWTLNLDVFGLPLEYDQVLESELSRRLLRGTEGVLDGPIPIATLPPDGDVRLRGLRTHVDQDLTFELGFVTLINGEVQSLPDPEGGFAVVLPAKTLLGIASAALIREGPQHGYLAEPTQLHLDQGGFEMWVKIWKEGRRERWREFVLRGTIGLDDANMLSFQTAQVAQVDKERWRTPLDPVIRTAIVDAMNKSLDVTFPGRYVHTIGAESLYVDVTRVEADAEVLTIWGNVH